MGFLNNLVKIEQQYLIEIGSNYIRLALFEKIKDHFKIKKFEFFYTKGLEEDDLFWTLFKKSLENFSIPEAKGAHLIFSPNYSLACAKSLPLIPKAEAMSYYMHMLAHDMHVKLSDYYLDHNIIKLEKENIVAGMVVGVKKSVSDRVVDMLSKVGIDVEKVETSIVSLESIFCSLDLIPKTNSILVIRLEQDYAELFFMKSKSVSFYKVSKFSLQDLKKSLARTVYTNSGPIEIDLNEASEMIDKVGYPLEEGSYIVKSDKRTSILEKAGHLKANGSEPKINYQQLRMLLSPALDSFSQEINAFISEYIKLFPEKEDITGIYTIGRGAKINGLGAFLEEKFSIPYLYVDLLHVTDNIELEANIADKDKTEMGLIPAVINKSSKKYSLISPYYRIIKETHKAKHAVYVYLLGLAGFLLFFYLGLNLSMFYLKKIVVKAESSYQELGPFFNKLEDVDKLHSDIQLLEIKTSNIYEEYFDWVAVLKQISNLISEDIVLEDIWGDKNSKDSLIHIKGNISAEWGSLNATLNNFVEKLEESYCFREVKILDTIHKGYRNQLYFELQCYLK